LRDVAFLNFDPCVDPEVSKISAQGFQRRRSTLDESYLRSSAAQGLKAYGAGSGIEIEKGRAADAGSEDVEEERLQSRYARLVNPAGPLDGR
jgi:hypothetical protein